MLLELDIERSTTDAAETNPVGVVDVSGQRSPFDLPILPAANEVGERERVPDRPPVLNIDTFIAWLPLYAAQCRRDALARTFARMPHFTTFIKNDK